jgi:hypothetical protein
MIKAVQTTLFVILIGGVCLLTLAWAQTPEAKRDSPRETKGAATQPPEAPAAPARPRAMRGRAGLPHGLGQPAMPAFGGGAWGVSGAGDEIFTNRHSGHRAFGGPLLSEEEIQEHQALEQAVDSLKSAKNDADKTNATSEISKLLEKRFKRDLERREKQIAEIEARVKKLQEQIEKRKKAKDDIISLQVKTIVNEAEGLGFPGTFNQDSDLPAGFFRRGMRTPAAHFDYSVPTETSEPLAPPARESEPADDAR